MKPNQLHSEVWRKLPWKKFRRNLFRLQHRVWKAVRAGDTVRARSLQKLILRSQGARLLAIRQVSQLNQGKKTAGIDGVKSLSFKQRFELERLLETHAFNWKSEKLREIPIPKKDGTQRILKIPTMKDRAWQCLMKSAMEPAHEATFHKKSYGFRPGRSAHDALRNIFVNLSKHAKGITKKILELDIEKCFDRIDQKDLMSRVIAPQNIKLGLWRCLKTGTNPEFPNQGTPQGSPISPLLANISLNGIEDVHISSVYTKKGTPLKGKKFPACVRYADDLVFFIKPEENPDKILNNVRTFLATRGLKVKASKTRITTSTDGFDFLGWNFKVQTNGKLRITPSEENFKTFKAHVKHIINNSNYGSKVKTDKLAPIIRGWRNYHRYCNMSSTKHSLWFINHRAWKVFNKEAKQNRYTVTELIKKAFPTVSWAEGKHVCVKGDKSPFDGNIIYWSKRNSKLYDGITAQILKKQNHTCGSCGLQFTDDERIHLHHIDGNHSNWKRKNLMVVHESCHDYIHMSKSSD